MKRNSFLRGAISSVFILVSLALITQSCKKEYEPLRVNPAFASYVISFTSGVVSNTTKVQVRLVQEVASAVPGEKLKSNPFSFSPGLDGEAKWVDKQTIEFSPTNLLPSGEIYTVDFDVKAFVDVPDSLETLTFRFQVIKQAIQYEFNGISPYKELDKTWQKVNGVFTTADYVAPERLEEIVTASANHNEFKMSWQHSKDGRIHSFSVDSVERKVDAYMIKVEWDATEIGAESDGDVEIEMPGLNDFKVMDVKVTNSPSTLIDVFFSDPISKTQDLKGLITLNPSAEESLIVSGNKVQVVPGNSLTGELSLKVYAAVKNVFGVALGKDYTKTITFVNLYPQVELIGDGVIFPNTDGILFPFKAVSLKAVDVKIIQIYENNIVQFLQSNQLNGNSQVKRVGRVVYSAEVPLTSDEAIDYSQWNNFAFDLAKFIEPQPGAIYRVEISFRKKHSLYACPANAPNEPEEFEEQRDPNEGYDEPSEYWSYYDDDDYGYREGYNWYEKDNPCKISYYMDSEKKKSRNVLASDMGIIAKAGSNNEYFVAVTDLRSTDPMDDIELEFRNFQNQVISTAETDGDGLCKVKLPSKPFVLIAKKDKQRGYLRLDDASSLSLSMFDVKGEELKKGVKGFIYGERGVWRPGDMMYLTFILEDKNNAIPANHPAILELYNPSGQLSQRVVKNTNLNGFYSFPIKTAGDAPTGNWSVQVRIGGSTFSRTLRVETVKPNRMKINLNFASKVLRNGVNESANLQVNWLHGAPAANCKVQIDATIAPAKTEFSAYKGYLFDDPTKAFVKKEMSVFSGKLNTDGAATVNAKIEVDKNTPGMVDVQMKTKAYDAGGDFSTDRYVMKCSPYDSYVGVRIPDGKGWNNALYSDEINIIPIVTVDQFGKPVNRKVKIEVFNVYWRWWWDQSEEENLADYVSNQASNLVKTDYVTTSNGKAMYSMNLNGQYWGRMYMRITDETGGHSTGAVFYSTYKDWWSNAGTENPGGAEMLMFNTDKTSYKVGEKVTVELPFTHKGRALISIETGSKVLENFWFEPSKGDSKFTFEVTPEMAPNIYIHVSYIQPHNHSKNDYPIRMYGVQGVDIEDPATHLAPVISMKNELKPEETFNVSVKETNGKAMTYTLAIVDEGLLDLTRFKTPNPWETFYTHEALGVRTWDLYKYVAGAFTGKMAGLLAIGGDEYLNRKGKENNNRFKPVVIYKGPFYLKAGETMSHQLKLPNYVGSVRVMVVAGQDGAYGSAEKAVPVRQSLMVLPTIPRVVSPTEVIQVPVTVFAMDKSAKNVTVTLMTDKNFKVLDGATRNIKFTKPGDQVVNFKIKVSDKIAQGKIVVVAKSGAISNKSETNLKIRMPNPPVSNVISAVVKPGQSYQTTVNAVGISGTNRGTIELSHMYPINLEKRMQYLVQYPHGCIEQTTSSGFPQLFLSNVTDLSESRKAEIERNIKVTLEKLKSFQLTNGGFAYWPGDSYGASDWGTNYAGHFMLEAQARGYQLPVGLLDPWISYQSNQANNWQNNRYDYSSDLNQAYRLYTLALAKKPVLSAMNRMRETAGICAEAKWRLAAAYALCAKPDIALSIIAEIAKMPKKNVDYYGTYGSSDRDLAMKLETLVLLKRTAQAKPILADVAKTLASQQWLSTQSTAYMLLSVAKYVGNNAGSQALNCEITLDGKKLAVNSAKAFYQSSINFATGLRKPLVIENNSKQNLYVSIQLQGIPLMTTQEAKAQNLSMQVNYFDMKGAKINPLRLKQGTEFYAEISVLHPGTRLAYTDLALEQLFPSGWEIINTRMDEIQSAKLTTDEPRYQDIRDDRVYMYFDLAKGQKKVFRVLLQAAYLGSFYMPAVDCEAMYDNTINARTKGQWVEVYK